MRRRSADTPPTPLAARSVTPAVLSHKVKVWAAQASPIRVLSEHGAAVPADADLPVVATDDLPDLERGELLGRRLEQLERGVAAPRRAALDAGAAGGDQLAEGVGRALLDRRHPPVVSHRVGVDEPGSRRLLAQRH